MNGRTVLITGGAGFIGSHVSERFVNECDDVYILDNLFTGMADYVPAEARFYCKDLLDDNITEIIQEINPDVLIHLAAIHYIPYCNKRPGETYEVNTWGTRRLLEACGQTSLDHLLYSSTAAVYSPKPEAHHETDHTCPIDVYGRSKLLGEDLVKGFADETGTPTTTFRLFNVFGTRETNSHLIPAILDQLKQDKSVIELGNLNPKRDFVHVTDVSRAVRAAVEREQGGYKVFNVGSGSAHSVREVVEEFSNALGSDIHIEQNSERVRDSDRLHLQASITRISEDLGWSPEVDMKEGLSELLVTQGIET